MKWGLLTVLGILAVIVVSGCTTQPIPTSNSICAEITIPETRRLCEAVVQGDPNICEGFYSYEKDACYFALAFNLERPDLCDKLPIDTAYDYHSCLMAVAVKMGDVSVCQLDPDTNRLETCKNIVAQKTKNLSICESLTDQRQLLCAARVTLDETYCSDYTGNECESGLEQLKAVSSNDPIECTKLWRLDDIRCLQDIEPSQEGTAQCSRLFDDRDRYICLAILQRNISQCNNIHEINNPIHENSSYWNAFICALDTVCVSGDTNSCDSLEPELVSSCYYTAAISSCNIAACTKSSRPQECWEIILGKGIYYGSDVCIVGADGQFHSISVNNPSTRCFQDTGKLYKKYFPGPMI